MCVCRVVVVVVFVGVGVFLCFVCDLVGVGFSSFWWVLAWWNPYSGGSFTG